MAYEFHNNPTASFQYNATQNTKALTINQISGSLSSATILTTGLAGLFWITDQHTDWEPEYGVRTLKQTVRDDE